MVDIHFEVREAPLDTAAILDPIRSVGVGALSLFCGTVRDRSTPPEEDEPRAVRHLEYEAYDRMARAEWARIARELADRHPGLRALACHHRTGRVEPGETAILVAGASPHRRAAIDAVSEAIDLLKERLPVWKKEVWTDGSAWVSEVGSG